MHGSLFVYFKSHFSPSLSIDIILIFSHRGVSRLWRDTVDSLQGAPGYWHTAASALLPRNCLLELVKTCCSDDNTRVITTVT